VAPRQRTPTRLQATGPIANVANIAVFLALYLTPDYAPALAVTSDAALIFYGASMLLAALRGYAGVRLRHPRRRLARNQGTSPILPPPAGVILCARHRAGG
jgi:ABC-type sulfate transport system permease component